MKTSSVAMKHVQKSVPPDPSKHFCQQLLQLITQMPTASKVDSLILEILTFCRIVGVKPSFIRDNFVRVDNDGEVFHPFDINYINRTVARNLNDSYNSYRRTPNGGKSVSVLFALCATLYDDFN